MFVSVGDVPVVVAHVGELLGVVDARLQVAEGLLRGLPVPERMLQVLARGVRHGSTILPRRPVCPPTAKDVADVTCATTRCAGAECDAYPCWSCRPPETPVDAPIGIFDSGFGGLTVARSVIDQLPHESVLYLGDTARQPYGPKPIAEVREYALECLDHLVDQGVKALVIACNSASAAMLRDARERYDVPVVEVILPATRRAVAASRTGRIGVICTRATAESMAYDDAFAAAPHVELTTQACPRFVDFVEAGVTGGDELLAVAHEYLDPLTARRRRHPDPRLHPLPAAHRRHLLRDGRRRHPGQQRRGVRQGRLQDARRAPA